MPFTGSSTASGAAAAASSSFAHFPTLGVEVLGFFGLNGDEVTCGPRAPSSPSGTSLFSIIPK